jgi:tRNA(adenine34) deaminase
VIEEIDLNIKYMRLALKEANKAFLKKEIPVGCVLVKDDKVIARAHNLRELKNDILGHSEILCLKKASKKLSSWRLDGSSIYVTLEPCLMCLGAILQARVSHLYIGALDPKNGAVISKLNLKELDFTHKIDTHLGLLEEDCSNLLKSFFLELRKTNSPL